MTRTTNARIIDRERMDIQKLCFALKFVMIIILIISFVAGCTTEKKEWQETVSENTIESYQIFMEHNPESSFCDSAKVAIRKIIFEARGDIMDFCYSKLIRRLPRY